MDKHREFMQQALLQAKNAAQEGEVPVGAVVVKNGKIIAVARNHRECGKDATAHAEIIAIQQACKALGSWRLSGCDLYVTLEPCPMCAGAIVNARVNRVIFGAKDARGGALGSVMDLRSYPLFSTPTVIGGICENECREVLQEFFKNKRNG